MKQQESSYIAYNARDDWKKFNYDSRYLDSLASIFLTHSAVTATVEIEGNIYLSYSNNPLIVDDQMRFFEFIKSCIAKGSNDQLLTIYLISNLDFRNVLNNLSRFTTKEEVRDKVILLEQDIKNNIKTLNTLLKKNKEVDQLDQFFSVIKQYKQLFLYKSELQDFEKFFRPIQDTYKLHYYFYKLGYSAKIKDIVVLPNPHAIHADTNIVANFPDSDLVDKSYIGVSKLCCGYCHTYLDKKSYDHRGTHGVCDDKWGFPWLYKETKSPLEDKFKASVQSIKEFDIKNPPPQHRRLSFDEKIEKDIFLEENFSLFNLKEKLDLIGEVHSTDMLESLYLNTSGYGGGCTI